MRKLPSGRWQARIVNGDGELVSLGSYPTKTTHRKPCGWPRRPGDAASGSTPAPDSSPSGEYATEWLRESLHDPTTHPELYESLLRNHILPDVQRRRHSPTSRPRLIRQWHSRLRPSS